jgi:SAM-dependent methyltransferase
MHAELLSSDEHESHGLHGEFRKRLKPGMRILDWGCGRGSDVLHLRKAGFDAYGAEIDPETIARGRPLFEALGIEHAAAIKPISADNETAFPAGFFDMIISYQVLEHVEDLPSAAREIARLLKPGGMSVHLYPAHLAPIEGHLFMPLVHWLPKNVLRRWAITACAALSIEPKRGWSSAAGRPLRERAARYYAYSIARTFYRPPRAVARVFREAGLVPRFESHMHERVRRTPLSRLPPGIACWVVSTFAGVVLVAEKPAAAVRHRRAAPLTAHEELTGS